MMLEPHTTSKDIILVVNTSSSRWFQRFVYPKDWQRHEHSGNKCIRGAHIHLLMIEAASWVYNACLLGGFTYFFMFTPNPGGFHDPI